MMDCVQGLTIPSLVTLSLSLTSASPHASRHTHKQLPEQLSVSVLTWNMGEKSPPMTDVANLVGMGLNESDLTVIGVQEVMYIFTYERATDTGHEVNGESRQGKLRGKRSHHRLSSPPTYLQRWKISNQDDMKAVVVVNGED